MGSMVLSDTKRAVGRLIVGCRGCHYLMTIYFMLCSHTFPLGNAPLDRIAIYSTTNLKGADQKPNGPRCLRKFSLSLACTLKIILPTQNSTRTLAPIQIQNHGPTGRAPSIKMRHHPHLSVIP